ncbi:CD225/dispanin family protein [Streptomyces sp. NPDC018019]|uniref:CD225/dispanin family protein n=1 Tax=Streptomyces sp. NPDC018019 TaxID=3365030 RepID=UPI00378973D3
MTGSAGPGPRLDAVGIKVTFSDARAEVAAKALAPGDGGVWCQVFFCEGPRRHRPGELPLLEAGVILRLRSRQGRAGDSTVRLRPCRRARVAGHWLDFRRSGDDELRLESDWSGEGRVLSASLTRTRDRHDIDAVDRRAPAAPECPGGADSGHVTVRHSLPALACVSGTRRRAVRRPEKETTMAYPPGPPGEDWGGDTPWNGRPQPPPAGPPPQYQPQYRPYAEPPRSYLVPAVLVTLLCFLPTGIAAIVFATQASAKFHAGDHAGAERASARARLWTFISLGGGLVLLLLVLIPGAAGGGGR